MAAAAEQYEKWRVEGVKGGGVRDERFPASERIDLNHERFQSEQDKDGVMRRSKEQGGRGCRKRERPTETLGGTTNASGGSKDTCITTWGAQQLGLGKTVFRSHDTKEATGARRRKWHPCRPDQEVRALG